ncbi:SAM-dependent methyltransferase [Nocardioides cavernae]|uniref:SAM-dependent methyltransferase n=1 Tax=Nocardioides cavernae TaxID=1921566 RepID=A0A7Y9KSH9_9ACTN|nr:class I SAM-dependent methyltransferase [Nocardioides cavernae]NYE36432.1 SAM-dependent methyltransferase [Nocardioides cavernae]
MTNTQTNTQAHTQAHTDPTPLQQLKAAQHLIWNNGDYGKIAWLTVPLAAHLLEDTGVRPGTSVLDVATGTGHVAIEAARMFCDVTGIDYVESLVDVARRRAAAEALPIAFEVADAEELPFADASFDAVVSAIGVMFTADHDRAAAELVRVCRHGGRIGVASWTAEGFIGRLLKTVTAHVPPPAVALPPTRWGNEEVVRELLGAGVRDVTSSTHVVTQRFVSAEAFADFMLTWYGPTYTAAQKLDVQGRAAFRDDLVALGRASDRATDGSFAADWEYRVVTATRAG